MYVFTLKKHIFTETWLDIQTHSSQTNVNLRKNVVNPSFVICKLADYVSYKLSSFLKWGFWQLLFFRSSNITNEIPSGHSNFFFFASQHHLELLGNIFCCLNGSLWDRREREEGPRNNLGLKKNIVITLRFTSSFYSSFVHFLIFLFILENKFFWEVYRYTIAEFKQHILTINRSLVLIF